MGSESDNHEFGGAWTEVKLRAISEYLTFYTKALESIPRPDRPFKLWYIDAFAGSGRRTSSIERGGIFEGEPTWSDQVE